MTHSDLEALTAQLADWMGGYLGKNPLPAEMKVTLERVADTKDRLFATFREFLDANRKMAESSDIQEATKLVLSRISDALINEGVKQSTTSLLPQNKEPIEGRKIALEHLVGNNPDDDAWWQIFSEHLEKQGWSAVLDTEVEATAAEMLARLTKAASKPMGKKAKAEILGIPELRERLMMWLRTEFAVMHWNMIFHDLLEQKSEQMPKLKLYLKDAQYKITDLREAVRQELATHTHHEKVRALPKGFDPERVKGQP